MRKLIVAVALLVTISSCASPNPEATSPVERIAYPKSLSAQDQATIAYRDTLRPLDPCAYLDNAALHRIGTPAYVGALFDFNNCVASFKSPDGDLLGSIHVSTFRGIGTPLDEIAYSPNPPQARCGANVPVSDRLSIMVIADGKIECTVVQDIARSAVPHRSERALRTASARAHINSRLATLDPCAVLGRVGQGRHPALASIDQPPLESSYQNTVNPWACTFRLDSGDDSTLQTIRYQFTNRSFTARVGSAEQESTVGGLSALESPGSNALRAPNSCTLDVSTTSQPAEPGPDRYNPMSDAWSTEVISIEAANGCAAARTTAEELVRLYHQLPR
ncbi:hypothetical protein AB0M22_31855 [Nocardia sp. NPDC051756]|uniref:hypothetical protein n=1 Tax=Nocardia sp. NPDC051756 TaxID=3154751 RepID=UPI0034257BC6